tara:strand:+ start:47 stop:1252 length:1206 start_codon:yes stop_codon:yes gene_type:complete
MYSVLFKLFHRTPIFQVLLSGISFLVLMVLIAIRLLYSYGISASFSNSTPHLTAEWIAGETSDYSKQSALQSVFSNSQEIESYSLFTRGTRPLLIEALGVGMVGTYRFEAPVEITGIDLSRHPFAIPLDQATSLINEHENAMTERELAAQLMIGRNEVVVNRAMINLFAPSPGKINRFLVQDIESGTSLSEIRIVAVLNDMIDTPRMFLSLPLAQIILEKQAIQGLHARVKNFDRLQIVRDSISKLLDSGVRVSSWVDGQNRQQKLFRVFDSIFWIIAVAILTLSAITGMLGIYRAFMTKRNSIAILLLLGVSKRTFYWMLASITEISLLGGAGLAALLFMSGYDTLNEQLLLSVQAMSPVESPELPLLTFFYWNGGMFILYSVLSLIFLKVILNTRISLK